MAQSGTGLTPLGLPFFSPNNSANGNNDSTTLLALLHQSSNLLEDSIPSSTQLHPLHPPPNLSHLLLSLQLIHSTISTFSPPTNDDVSIALLGQQAKIIQKAERLKRSLTYRSDLQNQSLDDDDQDEEEEEEGLSWMDRIVDSARRAGMENFRDNSKVTLAGKYTVVDVDTSMTDSVTFSYSIPGVTDHGTDEDISLALLKVIQIGSTSKMMRKAFERLVKIEQNIVLTDPHDPFTQLSSLRLSLPPSIQPKHEIGIETDYFNAPKPDKTVYTLRIESTAHTYVGHLYPPVVIGDITGRKLCNILGIGTIGGEEAESFRVASSGPRIEDLLGLPSGPFNQTFPNLDIKYNVARPLIAEKAFTLSRIPFEHALQLERILLVLQYQLQINHLLTSMSLPTPYSSSDTDAVRDSNAKKTSTEVLIEVFPNENGLAILVPKPYSLVTISVPNFEEEEIEDLKVEVEGEAEELKEGLARVVNETRNIGIAIWWLLKRWNDRNT